MRLIFGMLGIPDQPMNFGEYLTFGMVVVIVVGALAYLIYYFFTNLDHSSSKLIKDSGKIMEMEYTGEEEQTTADVALTISTDGLIPPTIATTTLEDSDWEIAIKRISTGEIIKIEVTEEEYKKHKVGDTVNIEAYMYWLSKSYSPWQIAN